MIPSSIKRLATISSLLFLLTACAAQPKPEGTATEVAADKSNLVCIREHKTGSHFTRKVCRTKEQMEEMERETREMLDSLPPGQTIGGAPQ